MIDKTQKQAVIYCRVSDPKQVREGDGLNSQETRCREFARRKDYAVVEVFKDDISGSLADRPAMRAMHAYLRKHRMHTPVVIIDDISRLARGLQERMASVARPASSFEDTLRTALNLYQVLGISGIQSGWKIGARC